MSNFLKEQFEKLNTNHSILTDLNNLNKDLLTIQKEINEINNFNFFKKCLNLHTKIINNYFF